MKVELGDDVTDERLLIVINVTDPRTHLISCVQTSVSPNATYFRLHDYRNGSEYFSFYALFILTFNADVWFILWKQYCSLHLKILLIRQYALWTIQFYLISNWHYIVVLTICYCIVNVLNNIYKRFGKHDFLLSSISFLSFIQQRFLVW